MKNKNVDKTNINEYKSVDEYLVMPYKKVVYQTNDSGNAKYFAEILELDSCFAEGDSEISALQNLNNTFRAYINLAQKKNMPIPMPFATADYGGKVLVRMPPTLHYRLSMIAKSEGVSLNQYIINAIVAGMNY